MKNILFVCSTDEYVGAAMRFLEQFIDDKNIFLGTEKEVEITEFGDRKRKTLTVKIQPSIEWWHIHTDSNFVVVRVGDNNWDAAFVVNKSHDVVSFVLNKDYKKIGEWERKDYDGRILWL